MLNSINIQDPKKTLFYCIVIILMLPLLQMKTKLVKVQPLKGSFKTEEATSFSFTAWFNGTYSVEQEKYLNEHFGFRNLFVRIYNQIQYSLFREAKANGVIVGNDNYLYEEDYILAYLGRDFIGEKKIKNKVDKLIQIRDTLKTINIDLIVVLAPGKGSFYPEYIPEKYNPSNKTTSNYEIYRKTIIEQDLNLLDFHSWFISMKGSSQYPLFPKTGIHWSKYGEFLVADSIIKYIHSLNNEFFQSHIILDKINYSKNILDTDDDIEEGMNLLFNIKDLKMAYPNFRFETKSISQLKALTIADSYYWGLFNSGLSKHAFNNSQFWFYNEQIYPESYDASLNVDDIELQKTIESNNIIILLSTDANLHKFAFGFIDEVYDLYFESN